MATTDVIGTDGGSVHVINAAAAGADSGCGVPIDVPLDAGDAVELARGMAALADPVRLRLVSLLAAAPAGEVCVCDVVGPLGRSQPTISHHLKVLGEAGLVRGDRRGKWVWYSLDAGRLAEPGAAVSSIGAGPARGGPARRRGPDGRR